MNKHQNRTPPTLLTPLLCAFLGMSTIARSQPPDTATGQIKAVIDKYVQSVDEADTKLASAIWSNAEDVSFIHPRGHEHGWRR